MNTLPSYNKTFRALGTINSIFIPRCHDIKAVLEAARRVEAIDDHFSAFKQSSDVSLINSNAGKRYVKVHADTIGILKRAVELSEETDGAFDVTTRALVDLWDRAKKQKMIPDKNDIEKACQLVGYQKLLLDEENFRVMLRQKNQQICLGGIAKGYAADEVKRILFEHDISNALINLGGNIFTMGEQQTQKPWIIGIQDPTKITGAFLGTLEMNNETAVTSGSNERFFIKNGRLYHHILDPRTGIPSSCGLLSVTLVGECSMVMDALATAIFVLGMKKGLPLLKRYHAHAIFIGTDGKIFLTKGLHQRFKMADQIDFIHSNTAV